MSDELDKQLDKVLAEYKDKHTQCEYMKDRYRKRRKDAIKKKGNKCVKCGSTKELELHHKSRKTKTGAIGKMSSASNDKWDKELAKTIVLCSACHKKETKKQFSKKTKAVKECLEAITDKLQLEEAKKGYDEFMEKRKLSSEEK